MAKLRAIWRYRLGIHVQWDTLQGLCTYLRQIMSTSAALAGLGVGDAAARPAAAALRWVWRDGCGMLGGMAFSAGVGPAFDAETKKWRMFADAINDLGLIITAVSVLLPARWFYPAYILSNVLFSFCGVAAGATRASLNSHFALCRNEADIAAKEGAQETAITLLGLLIGTVASNGLQRIEKEYPWLPIAWFLGLTVLHVVFNYLAMKALRMRSLNSQRLQLIAEHYLETGRIASVADVNSRESLFGWAPLNPLILVGADLRTLSDLGRAQLLADAEAAAAAASSVSAGGKKAGGPARKWLFTKGARRKGCCVVMLEGATGEDVVKAVFYGCAAMRRERVGAREAESFFVSLDSFSEWQAREGMLVRDLGWRVALEKKAE